VPVSEYQRTPKRFAAAAPGDQCAQTRLLVTPPVELDREVGGMSRADRHRHRLFAEIAPHVRAEHGVAVVGR
jgi:hypothetical protein